MRLSLAAALIALAACGENEPPPPLPAPTQETAAPWFICDGVDAPTLLVFERDGAQVRVAEYDKPNGAIVARHTFDIGAEEGAAGSIYTALLADGAEAGAIRQTNPGMLETPASAYTPPFTSVRLGERDIACRWLPRTRLLGFTGRRSLVVHEDADGDLIYTSYSFADAAAAQAIELSENGRATTFSVEVRDGAESVSPDGARFEFANAGYSYIVIMSRSGESSVKVMRGAEQIQSEPLIAYQLGEGG